MAIFEELPGLKNKAKRTPAQSLVHSQPTLSIADDMHSLFEFVGESVLISKAAWGNVSCHDRGFKLWFSHLSSTVTIVLTSWRMTPASALSPVVWTASKC